MPNTMPKSPHTHGALEYVRVLDLADDRAIYAGKLLGDLGASVLRLEPRGGDPLRERGPFRGGASLWHAFFASSRRIERAEFDTDAIVALASCADVVIDCGRLRSARLSHDELLNANPALVIVDVTSFGRDGPWADYQAPALVAEALGGVAATSGDADTPPLKLFGDQYAFIAGVYAAIAALAGLHHARETGEGQVVGLAVHEALASVLEHVLMWAWYDDQLPFGAGAAGAFLPRQGSLHWSRAYQVMQARGGSIMITPTPDFQKQLAWLAEEGAHEDLLDPKYAEPENIVLMIERSMEVLRKWAATKDVEPFFHEAQRRHHPYGWVMPIPEVAANPQLDAREWWTEYPLPGGGSVRGPGAPYQFADTPAAVGGDPSELQPATTEQILDEIGWAG